MLTDLEFEMLATVAGVGDLHPWVPLAGLIVPITAVAVAVFYVLRWCKVI